MLKIELLAKHHDREAFRCSEQDLDEYLKKTARQHNEKGISRTFILVDSDEPKKILGFFTLTSCEVITTALPERYAKKYPSRAPAAKLARLAVSIDFQRRGFGKIMMVEAMRRTLAVSENIGIIGFFVDAKNKSAREYYEQFGFVSLPSNPLSLFLPLSTLAVALQRAG
ncbi:GNAT family N-acetyltransferase [Geoalkalibacter halelectricus]|uniref:GNAT family N-acetyltransferase n=1 Tax=Geoalkalibacter halelectricus TaxID=2847045 RepID=UPI003D1D7FA6